MIHLGHHSQVRCEAHRSEEVVNKSDHYSACPECVSYIYALFAKDIPVMLFSEAARQFTRAVD